MNEDLHEPASHGGLDLPLERVRAGGPRRPIGLAIGIAALLGTLLWQPWQSGASPIAVPPGPPAVARGSAAPSPATPGPALDAGLATYASLTDNEWTVVALVSPDAAASTEEPSLQHAPGPTWTPDGPYLVLQQGLTPVSASSSGVEAPTPATSPRQLCRAPAYPRDRIAVHLSAGVVAYLGVTFPGMDPNVRVIVTRVGGDGAALRRVSPVVRLRGMSAGPYQLPSTGPGAAILFETTSPGMLPSAAYRFEVLGPEPVGHRYLYACVGA